MDSVRQLADKHGMTKLKPMKFKFKIKQKTRRRIFFLFLTIIVVFGMIGMTISPLFR